MSNTSETIELPAHLRINPFAPKAPPQPPTATRSITRRGKIARLPHSIRETLNRRLADGEVGHKLLTWLNAQPEVQTILAGEFEGRAITEQNLSEWRQGGYADWEQKEALRESLVSFVEEMDELDLGENQRSIADRCAELQALALGRLLMAAMAEPDSEQRERRILALVRSINSVRRCDHERELVRLKREQHQQAQVGKGTVSEDKASIRERAQAHAYWHECFRQEFDKTDAHRQKATPPQTTGEPPSPSIAVHSVL